MRNESAQIEQVSRFTPDYPIEYKNRTYGTTNISRWTHGAILLRMLVFAALRLKFI